MSDVSPPVAIQALPDVAQAFSDILTLLRARARSQPDATAILHFDDQARSYAALLKRVESLAAHFIQGRTDRPRIAIVMPNGGAFSETLLAVTVVGVALPFNPAYTLSEFESYFAETEIDFWSPLRVMLLLRARLPNGWDCRSSMWMLCRWMRPLS